MNSSIRGNGSGAAVFFVLAFGAALANAATLEEPQNRTDLSGPAKECYELAWSAIRASGRAHNAERSGLNEKENVVDIWIGKFLFKVPPPYVNIVSGGYRRGTPGISAILVAMLPDMKVAKEPFPELINGVNPVVQITLTCAPFEYAMVNNTATRTRDDYIKTYLHIPHPSRLMTLELPDLGLIGYKSTTGPTTIYFPANPKTKNLHGGALAMVCHEPYPPESTLPRALCISTFAFRDGIAVQYQFPEHFMKYWRTGYESLVRTLNSFLVEK